MEREGFVGKYCECQIFVGDEVPHYLFFDLLNLLHVNVVPHILMGFGHPIVFDDANVEGTSARLS